MCSSPDFAQAIPLTCFTGGGTTYTTTCQDLPPLDSFTTECDLANDPCPWPVDLECDANTFCPANTDCFDCDPFMQYRSLGCQGCIANGGAYCETNTLAGTQGVCSSPEIAAALPNACIDSGSGGTAYTTICTDLPALGDSCVLETDSCIYAVDLECDAGTFCPLNSDCFDCDPFQQYGSCDECIANGGVYCVTAVGVPVCSSPEIAAALPGACSDTGGSAYTSTCDIIALPQGCDVLADSCDFAQDFECDAGTFCPDNTDCFDCDPFQQYGSLGCQGCVANGGQYCETAAGTPVCSSPEVAAALPGACSDGGGTAFTTTCTTTTPGDGICNVLDDSCVYAVDFECDASIFCPANTDCFDCDPFQQFANLGCETCVANGGVYCELSSARAACSSPEIAAALPGACSNRGGTVYTTDCDQLSLPTSGECNVLNDACIYEIDFECDAGTFCSENTDCFDCDPFMLYSSMGCAGCVTNGGEYCQTDSGGACSDPTIAAAVPDACSRSGGTAYFTNCDDLPPRPACDFENDSCIYANDGECDAGIYCPSGSDCFDCSPCQQFRFQGCEVCTANGCLWCAADAACLPGEVSVLPSSLECTATDLVGRCPATNNNPFPDPLFDASDWIYEMINVKPVWAAGITGAGVVIRINDSGVDASHPDFAGKFDVDSSCTNYVPFTLDARESHGTACASLAAAASNGDCSVGMAPDATVSACRIFNEFGGFDEEVTAGYLFLYDDNQENVSVSSNSFGLDACYYAGQGFFRRLQESSCPFSQENEDSPCGSKSLCTDQDWSTLTLSSSCEDYIVGYCQQFYESDVQGCIAYLDLFVDCEYNAQTQAEIEAMTRGVTEGRNGKGIVYMYAAGNEFQIGEDIG